MNINGIEIFIEQVQGKNQGNGEFNFVLIHNAGGGHQFFTHQIEMLKHYGNVVLLDLPGHGSSHEMPNNRMEDLSLLVSNVCEKLSLKNICFIGLNNGANIVLDILQNHSLSMNQAISAVVLIDPPIFMEQSFIDEINHFIDKLETIEDYSAFVETLADALFIKTDLSNKEIAKKAFLTTNKKTLQNIFRGLIEWDANSLGRLKNIGHPTLCILTDEHHCSYQKLKQEASQFEIGKVVGSKCWATLEVPEQVNAMIKRFVETL